MADALLAALQATPPPTAPATKTAVTAATPAGADPFAALIATLAPAAPATAMAADPASTLPAITAALALPTPIAGAAKPAIVLATPPATPTEVAAKSRDGETATASDDTPSQDEEDDGAETASTPTLEVAPTPAPLPPMMAALIAATTPAPEPVAANDIAPSATTVPARAATLRIAPRAIEPQAQFQSAADATNQPAVAFTAVAALVARDGTTDAKAAPIVAPVAEEATTPAADPAPKATAKPILATADRPAAKVATATPRDTIADKPSTGEDRNDGDRETAPIHTTRSAEPAAPAPLGFDHRLRAPAVAAANDAPAATAADAALARTLGIAQDGQWLDGLARDIAATASGSTLHFRLDPVHLGGLSVAIQHDADGATVRMTADRAETRTMLADAQPRLAAEARAQGLTIKHAQVDGGTADDRGASQTATANGGTANGSTTGQSGHQSHRGRDPAMIETFAGETPAQTVGQTSVTEETARYA